MTALRLRLPESRRDILVLEPGVHALTASALGVVAAVEDHVPLAHVYVDARGVWLQVREGLRGAYVNGRPIRHMAMLRAGDALFLHGHEVLLVGPEPLPVPTGAPSSRTRGSVRCVLRAVGGPNHGRCFSLGRSLSIGADADCDVRIDDARIAARHVTAEPVPDGVAVSVAPGGAAVAVNGHPVDAAMMRAGDQLVLAGTHRFVVEAPRAAGTDEAGQAPVRRPAAPAATPSRRATRRIPWLLLAAILLATALSLLLLYGAG